MRQEERMSDVPEGPTEISRDNRKGMIPKVIEMMLWLISKIFGVLGHSMRAFEREKVSQKTLYSIDNRLDQDTKHSWSSYELSHDRTYEHACRY